MASALDMLRHYNVYKKLHKIMEKDDRFVFGKLSWPKKSKTNLIASSSSQQEGGQEKFYTLESLVFFLQHIDSMNKEYVRKANYKNISIIHEKDRQAILEYFNGKSSNSVPDLRLKKIETSSTKKSSDKNDKLDTAIDDGNGSYNKCETFEKQQLKPMPNPLDLLRSYTINKLEIIEKDGLVIFGENIWKKNMKTNLQISGSGKNGTPKEYYTLNCLLFFLKNVLLPHPAYVCRAKNIIKYLNGEVETISNINKNIPYVHPVQIQRSPVVSPEQVQQTPDVPPEVEPDPVAKIPEIQKPIDPLTMLRQYVIEGKQIIEKDGTITFGEVSWPKDVSVNYQIWGKNGSKEYYTLECLVYFLRNVSLRHPVYVNQAKADHVPFVRRPDRQYLLDYLKGVTNKMDRLDKSMLFEISNQMICTVGESRNKTVKKRQLEECNPIEKRAETEQISLADALSMERIAAIKAKRLANKRKKLKTGEKEDVKIVQISGLQSQFF